MDKDFLPVSRVDMEKRGWSEADFVYVIGDAYVDHPSFGVAIISRVLEAHGYSVGIIAQPDWKDDASIRTDRQIPTHRVESRITDRIMPRSYTGI